MKCFQGRTHVLVALVVSACCAIPGAASASEGRVWELVTPANKLGARVEPPNDKEGGVVEASENGEKVTYITDSPPVQGAQGNRALEMVQNVAQRTASGWASRDLTSENDVIAPLNTGELAEYRLFSGDLSTSLVDPAGETPLTPGFDPETYEKTLYLHREDASGNATLEPLVSPANVLSGTHYWPNPTRRLVVEGASSDLSEVVFSSQEGLTPEVPTETSQQNLYLWRKGGAGEPGKISLLSVLPDEEAASGSGSESEARLGTFAGGASFVSNAISRDGSRVFWTSGEGFVGGQAIPAHLYMRDLTSDKTVRLDLEGNETNQTSEVAFMGANAAGTRVFFTDIKPLTAGSHAAGGRPDLYVAEIGEGLAVHVTDLTESGEGPETGGLRGVTGYSEDGSRVYFVAGVKLTPGAAPSSCAGESPEGTCSLYKAQFQAGRWGLRLVANIEASDISTRLSRGAQIALRATAVSPSGQYLAFMSQRSLTGFNNLDAQSGEPDQEVYLFNAATNGLLCVSCNRGGTPPHGVYDPTSQPPEFQQPSEAERKLFDPLNIWPFRWLAASLPTGEAASLETGYYQPRDVSNSGHVFFNARDALVPADSNEQVDVYEYLPADEAPTGGVCSPESNSAREVYSSVQESQTEAPGAGEAGPGVADGCVALISSGTSSAESIFLDATENGGDAFILTAAPLARQDHDSAYDIYDARVCPAGATCTVAVSEPQECLAAEACRGALPQGSTPGAPASSGAVGDGNVTPVVVKQSAASRRLAAALKSCRKIHARMKRTKCERRARAKYAPSHKASNKG